MTATIRGRLPRLRAKVTGTLGTPFSGAKMRIAAGAGVVQFAGLGGFLWDGLPPGDDNVYDTDGYIQAYGANPNNIFDDDAIVFKVPSDGVYRVSGTIQINRDNPGYWTDATGVALPRLYLDSDGDVFGGNYTFVHQWNASAFPNDRTVFPSPIVWEGIIRYGDDGLIGLWVDGPSDLFIEDKSWMSIQRLGDAPEAPGS